MQNKYCVECYASYAVQSHQKWWRSLDRVASFVDSFAVALNLEQLTQYSTRYLLGVSVRLYELLVERMPGLMYGRLDGPTIVWASEIM